MNTITNNQKLNESIAFLEKKQERELYELKNCTTAFLEVIKPSNLLDNVVNSFSVPAISSVKSNILTSAISLASGYISRKFIEGSTNNFFRKTAGYALQFLVTKLVSRVQKA